MRRCRVTDTAPEATRVLKIIFSVAVEGATAEDTGTASDNVGVIISCLLTFAATHPAIFMIFRDWAIQVCLDGPEPNAEAAKYFSDLQPGHLKVIAESMFDAEPPE
jgi:hypothetical protein